MITNYNIYNLFIEIFTVGLLELIKQDTISITDAQTILFSPAGLERIENNPYLKCFLPTVNAGMELEDIYDLLGEEKFYKKLEELKDKIISEINLPTDDAKSYEHLHEILLLITDTGIGNFYKLK
ncbi:MULTISPECIES: DUF3969 family protein [Moraxella]|uniref:Uncharacterized protein n=1 Tax=Faucicola atlantae TaxID=34059 RepID=A0A378QMG7_9GAMM|nr:MULTISPECIES: DUF3969 family protein [Moraxella]OPH35827.1 hypothetical protein B5J92_04435 [Moraxella atlantae]STZ01682.1 Uncharacterised protein [Moraxella atlantae]